MSNIWLKLILIFTISVLSTGAVQANDACSARLVTNRYYGPFRILLNAGKLTPKDLAEALKSNQPYNPFAKVHPPLELESASDYFAGIVNDPEVIADWRNTQSSLAILEKEVRGRDALGAAAHRATELVLNPTRVRNLEATAGMPEWTVLPDGTARVAYVRKEPLSNVDKLIIESPAGESRFTANVPAGFQFWDLTWYRHTDGSVWLYALGSQGLHSPEPYRMKWGSETEFKKIEIPELTANDKPNMIGTPGPGFLLLKVLSKKNTLYNLATSPPRPIAEDLYYGAQSAAVDRNGQLKVQRYLFLNREKESVLAASSGRLLDVVAGAGTDLTIEGADDPRVRTHLQKTSHSTEQLLIYEAPDKEIFIGLLQVLNLDMKRFSIFRPSVSDKAFYSFDFPTNSRSATHHEPHFFKGPRYETYLGIGYNDVLTIHDITNKSEVLTMNTGAFVIGWGDHDGQTYFWTSGNSAGTSIYKLFGRSGRAPNAVEIKSNCEERLASNRYYGPFRALLNSGKLTLKDLAKARASNSPYNPFAKGEPPTELLAAQDYFTDVVQDPEIIAGWRETQASLAVLEEDFQRKNIIRTEAERATEHVLKPEPVGKFERPISEPAWTTLANGETRFAYMQKDLQGDGVTLQVLSADGQPNFSAKAPANLPHWWLTWYRHTDGVLWLYALGAPEWDSNDRKQLYRLQWGAGNDFQKVELPGLGERDNLGFIHTPGPGYILVTTTSSTNKIFNLAKSPPEPIKARGYFGRQSAAVDRDGNLVVQKFLPSDLSQQVYLAGTGGRMIGVTAEPFKILVSDSDSAGPPQELEKMNQQMDKLFVYEAPNQEIFIGIIQAIDFSTKRLSVWRPSVSNKVFYSFNLRRMLAAQLPDEPHFFQGLHGHTYVGVGDNDGLMIHDLENKTEVLRMPESATLGGWFDSAGQTFFWQINSRKEKSVIKVFSKSSP